ncbi:hypothetical protein HAX54_010119 [Datura stramonium]|uniref:Uncharacterized protein n=1 Tax=Datura stramonium TaxID=4076 RepID=A0ABS8THM7_DATST|nr:hypothetical protein [Datura stramonium]
MVRGEEDGGLAEGWWTMRKGREKKGEEDGGEGCDVVSPENCVRWEVGICGPQWLCSSAGAQKTKGRKSDTALKKCTWSPAEDYIIRSNFKKKTASPLLDMFSKAPKEEKPGWLRADYWRQLNLYWAMSEFQKKSVRTKAARREASFGRSATCDEVWKKTQSYTQVMKELMRSRLTDDQGNPIMPSEEETLSCWLDVVGGMYKGRAYTTFAPRKTFTSSNVDCKELRELVRKYKEEQKRRIEEERRRMTLELNVKEFKAQVNTLIILPRSPPPTFDDDDGEDEEDRMNRFHYGLPEDCIAIVLKEALMGLNDIHSAGRTHKSFNVGNIFVNFRPRPVSNVEIKLVFAATVDESDLDTPILKVVLGDGQFPGEPSLRF